MDVCVSGWRSKGEYATGSSGNSGKLNATNLQQYIAVSSLQFIYILDSLTLNILGKTISPTNPNKLIVEVKFFDEYLITLARNFTAYTIEGDVNKGKEEGVIVNGGGEMVNGKDDNVQEGQMVILNKYR